MLPPSAVISHSPPSYAIIALARAICVYENPSPVLNAQRKAESGDTAQLASAIRAGADLRVGTGFRHNEHIDPTSENQDLVREVMDLRITYLIEDHWVAGIENLRVPIQLPDGFGPRESMSFFLYNQDGH